MLKHAVVTMASVVALAGFAQAAPWKVTVSVSPAGTATVSGANVGFNSYTGSTTRTVEVTAKSAYNLKKVVVNGQTQTLEGNSFSRVFDPAVKTSNTLSATLAIKTFSITSTAPKNESGVALGAFSPTKYTGVKYDTARSVALIPKKGQAITGVTDNGVAASLFADRAGTTAADLPSIDPVYVVYKQVRENHALAATMETAPALQARITPNLNQSKPFSFFKLNAENTLPLSAARSVSQGTITKYEWSVNSTNATVTPNTADNGKTAKFDALSGGSFTVTVKVTATVGEATVEDSASVVINVTGDPFATACNSCHKDQGAIVASSIHQTNPYRKVECQSCHNNHSAGLVAAPASSVCYSCHGNYLTKANTAHAATATVVQNLCRACHSPHSTATAVPEAHFNGYTSTKNPKYAAAYVRPDGTCAECHSSSTDATLQAKIAKNRKDWAASGHGEVEATPWKNNAPSYIWTTRGTASVADYRNSPQSTNCVRCHTARGFAQFVDSGFTNVKPLAGSTNAAPLTCGGCHASIEDASDTKGLRQLSSGYTGFYGFSTATYLKRKVVVSKSFGDMKNSNVCIPCHSGRSSGALIKAMYAVSDISHKVYSSGSVSYPHDMTPAGVLVSYGGYDFTPYDGTGREPHRLIGLNNYKNTGSTQGPCVACHMTSEKSHSFDPIENGQLATALCAKCHTNFTIETVNAAKANFAAALKVLGNELDKKGLKLGSRVAKRWDSDPAVAAKNNGAWYNWFYFGTSDKAAYVHNPAYARKLIYDSIDWLDDNVMNSSAAATIANQVGNSSFGITSEEALQASAYAAGNGCAGCHTSQDSLYGTSKHLSNPYRKVGCSDCHNNHYTGFSKLADAEAACYTCHQNYLSIVNTTHANSTAAIVNECVTCHNQHTLETEVDVRHFNGYTSLANPNYRAAYVIPGVVCANCHQATNDEAINVIREGWAESGHGDVNAVPWKSRAWNNQGTDNVNFQNSPQATSCVRCHTAQGFAAFVDSNFQSIGKLGGNYTAPLGCNGCHTSANGGLRLTNFVGGYKAFWGYSSTRYAGKKVITTIQLPDNKNSNICYPCHSQRASGQQIKDIFAQATFRGYSIGSRIYPHAAQPAAIWAGKGGYEFTAQGTAGDASGFGYNDRARHQRIGNYGTGTGYNDTGVTAGSCAVCHMSSDKTHSFEAIAKDENGKFTQIVSTACSKCHPSSFTYQDLQAKKDEFEASVKALGKLLVAKGITKDGINPLPERTAFDMSLGTFDLVKAEKNTGAWFNWYLMDHGDKAAWAHNPSYARRLIYDSIDWLDDNVLNGTAASTIANMAVNKTGAIAKGTLTKEEAQGAIANLNEPGCLGCHFGTGSTHDGEDIPGVEQAPHFNKDGALVPGETFTQAQFVSANNQCNTCHGYGHGSDSPRYSFTKASFPNISTSNRSILKNYAESGHGEVNAFAWADYDFKTRDSCNACHTATGFSKAVANNWTNVKAFANASSATVDTSKEVLSCNACHSSTAWKTSVRTIPGGYTAGMGGFGTAAKATIQFADVGESNVCIPCHAGRENGGTIKTITDFTNADLKRPHYLGAAAVFYGKGGFQFYTSSVRYNTYGAAGKIGRTANWSHGRIGMDNYTASRAVFSSATTSKINTGVVRGTGNKGQCVGCHVGPTNTHSFNAFDVMKATWGTNATGAKGCFGCHNNEDMEHVAEEEKQLFDRGMDFFKFTLAQNNIFYNGAVNPYFFKDNVTFTSANAIKNWTQSAAVPVGPVGGTGAQTMGTAHNFALLIAEKGAHVHNRAFARALIADSIVYLQKGDVGNRSTPSTDPNNIMNFTNYSTALAATPDSNPTSISQLKGWILRKSGSNYTRR